MADNMPELGGRSGSIGGTSWGALLGLSRWKTEHDVWVRAMRMPEEEGEPTPAMLNGIRLEPVVSALAVDALKMDLREPEIRTERWPEPYVNFTSSIDRLAFDSGGRLIGPVELKTMSARGNWGERGPANYQLQLQSYLHLCHLKELAAGNPAGCNWGALVCLQAPAEALTLIRTPEDARFALENDCARLHVEHFSRDPAFEEDAIPYAMRWWARHVEGREMPPVDGSHSCTLAIRSRYADRDGDMEATAEIEDIAHERELVREKIAALKDHKSGLDNRLRDAMGAAHRAQSSRVRIQIANVRGRRRFDARRFALEHPDLYSEYMIRGGGYDRISVDVF